MRATAKLAQGSVPKMQPLEIEVTPYSAPRRHPEKDLDKSERTKLAYDNYRKLVDRVDDVFGEPLKASAWLSTPNPDFGGVTPLEAARAVDYDVEALEPVLIRMEHGVFV